MDVVIGIDPHKASHTAVAVGDGEVELARLKVRSGRDQVGRLFHAIRAAHQGAVPQTVNCRHPASTTQNAPT